jgi:hypothetical protein
MQGTALLGRAIAAVGVVLGFVAIWTTLESTEDSSAKYADDGTVMAYLLITLIPAALLIAAGLMGRSGLDLPAAALGSAAFGYFLFTPAVLAFAHLDVLGAGAWLGVCTALIPIGAGIARSAAGPAAPAGPVPPQLAAPVVLGLILCLIGIWLKTDSAFGGLSFWNLSASGDHWLGILMLLLVVLDAVFVLAAVGGAAPAARNAVLVLSAATFGLVGALLITEAFGEFGNLKEGGWLEFFGGLVLLVGAVVLWRGERAPAAQATPAPAGPPA